MSNTSHITSEMDTVQAAHGRAPAVATGMKRAMPDKNDIHPSQDGFSIGTAEIVHAATRGGKNYYRYSSTTVYME